MNRLKTFLVDFVSNTYILVLIHFLINFYCESFFDNGFNIKLLYFIAIAFMLSFRFIISKDTLGSFLYLNKEIFSQKKAYNTYIFYAILIGILLTFITGVIIVEINPVKFFMRFSNTLNILKDLFNPNFELFYPMLLKLIETIFLALMATILAIPFAFFLSFFAARNLMPNTFLGNTIYTLVRTIATAFRSIEAIVWAIIFSVWVGIGPFAGMLALMIHSIASLVKLYSEQIENIDNGPIEAIQATGANFLQVWTFAVIPQIISPFLAFTIYRWDINIRMATIVGFVGGGGIGQALQQQQQLLRWKNVSMIMILIAFTVWIMDMISGKLRNYLMNK